VRLWQSGCGEQLLHTTRHHLTCRLSVDDTLRQLLRSASAFVSRIVAREINVH
jgi:hypothetical protein